MQYREMLEAAVRAPSGDNLQPWRFEIAGGRIHVYLRPEADTSLISYQQRASYAAVGAVLENLRVAAGPSGFREEISLFPQAGNELLVATITLRPAEKVASRLYEAIFERSNTCGMFKKTALDCGLRDRLAASVEGILDARMILVENKRLKKRLAGIIGLNDRTVFENEALHSFMFNTLRWTPDDVENSRCGLDTRLLRTNAVDLLLLKHVVRRFGVTNVLNSFGLSRYIGARAAAQANSSSALGVVAIEGTCPADYVAAGMLLQRFWLTAVSLGLSCHLMSGLPFLMQRVSEGAIEGTGFSPQTVSMFMNKYREARQLLELQDNETIALFLRVGYAERLPLRSVRRKLAGDVIVKA